MNQADIALIQKNELRDQLATIRKNFDKQVKEKEAAAKTDKAESATAKTAAETTKAATEIPPKTSDPSKCRAIFHIWPDFEVRIYQQIRRDGQSRCCAELILGVGALVSLGQ